jgi:hypothetical protein
MNRENFKKLVKTIINEIQQDQSPVVKPNPTDTKISYSAVILDEESQKNLKDLVDQITVNSVRVPILVDYSGWEWYCHHMTICMGSLPDQLKAYIGSEQDLTVNAIGKSDKAVAVRVEGLMAGHRKNGIAHVTVAVNSKGGGKPSDSNKITEWVSIDKFPKLKEIIIKGRVEEVPQVPQTPKV